MSVRCGTVEFETALISLAPSLMIPPCSYRVPTMKPVMFCTKRIGVSVRLHSAMNCAPFCASGENRMPLLATTPIG